MILCIGNVLCCCNLNARGDAGWCITIYRYIKVSEMAVDKDGNDVYLAPSQFILDMEQGNFPEITFHTTSEFKTAQAV